MLWLDKVECVCMVKGVGQAMAGIQTNILRCELFIGCLLSAPLLATWGLDIAHIPDLLFLT